MRNLGGACCQYSKIKHVVHLGKCKNNMFDFGVLTACAILVALLADFFLMPAIMKLIIKDKESI